MLYLYKKGDQQYIVSKLETKGDHMKVKFIARVNGGKGRMPKDKSIPLNELNLLIEYRDVTDVYM